MASETGSLHREVAEALAPWFADRLGVPEARVEDVRRHAEGFSWETYTLSVRFTDLRSGEERERGFAVRREPEDGLVAPYDIEGQYRLHAAVEGHAGVPMPRLLALERDPSILGMPFYAMDRLEGRVPVPNDAQPFASDAERDAVARQFVDVLACIHDIDWRSAGLALPGVDSTPENAPSDALDRWSEYYEQSRLLEVPLVREAILWLRANLAGSGRLALCHGDYRLGNFMIDGDRIVGIFDWELGHVGDPAEDLAWSALPAFQGRTRRASAMLPTGDLLARYRDATGLAVDAETLRFWTVLGHVKTTAIFLRGCRAFEERRATDIRLAALSHRSLYLLREIASELGLRRGAA